MEGGYSGPSQTRSSNISDNFHFWGSGGGRGTLDTTFLKYLSGGTQGIWIKNSHSLVLLCIIDSLSHTTCVETNDPYLLVNTVTPISSFDASSSLRSYGSFIRDESDCDKISCEHSYWYPYNPFWDGVDIVAIWEYLSQKASVTYYLLRSQSQNFVVATCKRVFKPKSYANKCCCHLWDFIHLGPW